MTSRFGCALGLAMLAGAATWAAINPLGASGVSATAEGPESVAAQPAASPFTANQEYVFEVIRNRRTVRNFLYVKTKNTFSAAVCHTLVDFPSSIRELLGML